MADAEKKSRGERVGWGTEFAVESADESLFFPKGNFFRIQLRSPISLFY